MRNKELDYRLEQIGFQIRSKGSRHEYVNKWIDIEATLLDACYEIRNDARLLALLMSWLQVHGRYVIIEKLMKLTKRREKIKGENPWVAAIAAFAVDRGFHKWKRLVEKQAKPVYLHDRDLVQSLIRLNGEEEYLSRQNFVIPKGSLRIRESDVLSPEQLVRINRQYRNRYLYGASWRADIITAIEEGLKNPFQIAKTIGCSYEPAHRVFSEYKMVSSVTP